MNRCINCEELVETGGWYNLTHPVVPVTGAPNVTATIREGLDELFQNRIEVEDTAGLCERCFYLLSVAISMRRTSSDALEQFISVSSNVHVKDLDVPLLYNHLNSEINTKLLLQEGADWYSVIANVAKDNVMCYSSLPAVEYIDTIQGQLSQFFKFCAEKSKLTKEISLHNKDEAGSSQKQTCKNVLTNKITIFKCQISQADRNDNHGIIDSLNQVSQEDGNDSSEITDSLNQVSKVDGNENSEIIDSLNQVSQEDGNVNSKITDSLNQVSKEHGNDNSEITDHLNLGSKEDENDNSEITDSLKQVSKEDRNDNSEITDSLNQVSKEHGNDNSEITDSLNLGSKEDENDNSEITDSLKQVSKEDRNDNSEITDSLNQVSKEHGNDNSEITDSLNLGNKEDENDNSEITDSLKQVSKKDSNDNSEITDSLKQVSKEHGNDNSEITDSLNQVSNTSNQVQNINLTTTDQISDNQGPVDNSNYLEPVDEWIDQEPVNKGNDQEPVDTINEHGEIEKTNDKVPVISAEGISLAVKALVNERMEKKSINQVILRLKDRQNSSVKTNVEKSKSKSSGFSSSKQHMETSSFKCLNNSFSGPNINELDLTSKISHESECLDQSTHETMIMDEDQDFYLNVEGQFKSLKATKKSKNIHRKSVNNTELMNSQDRNRIPGDNEDIITPKTDRIKSDHQRSLEKLSSFMNENEVTPEKRLETMEKSKTAVESYKKIIQDSQSKKIIQDNPSKKIGQIRDKSEETMKKNENINVFESFKLDQYIADNSNLRMTSVLASQNPKIGTNPEKHTRIGRIMENVPARDSGKLTPGSSKTVTSKSKKDHSDIRPLLNNDLCGTTDICPTHKMAMGKISKSVTQKTLVSPVTENKETDTSKTKTSSYDDEMTFISETDEFTASEKEFDKSTDSTTIKHHTGKSTWSLKVNMKKGRKPLKLKRKLGNLPRTKQEVMKVTKTCDKNEISPEILFEPLEESFYSKSIKQNEMLLKVDNSERNMVHSSTGRHLSVLTNKMLENLQPVVQLKRLSIKQIEQMSKSPRQLKQLSTKNMLSVTKTDVVPVEKTDATTDKKTKLSMMRQNPSMSKRVVNPCMKVNESNFHESMEEEDIINNPFIAIDSIGEREGHDNVSIKIGDIVLQKSDVNVPYPDDDAETEVSFPDQDDYTDVSFTDKGADVDLDFTDDSDNTCMPVLTEKDTFSFKLPVIENDGIIDDKPPVIDKVSVLIKVLPNSAKGTTNQISVTEAEATTNINIIETQNASLMTNETLERTASNDEEATTDILPITGNDTNVKTPITGNDTNVKTSVTENETNVKTSVTENERNVKTSITENERNVKTSITENEANIKTSVTENETNVKTPVTENEANVKTSVTENEANVKTSVTENEANVKTSVTENETNVKTSVIENEANIKTSVTENETNGKTSVTENKKKDKMLVTGKDTITNELLVTGKERNVCTPNIIDKQAHTEKLSVTAIDVKMGKCHDGDSISQEKITKLKEFETEHCDKTAVNKNNTDTDRVYLMNNQQNENTKKTKIFSQKQDSESENPVETVLTENEDDSEIKVSMETDNDGRITRKGVIPKKVRILRSSQWLEQHYNIGTNQQSGEIVLSVDSDEQSENSGQFKTHTKHVGVNKRKEQSAKISKQKIMTENNEQSANISKQKIMTENQRKITDSNAKDVGQHKRNRNRNTKRKKKHARKKMADTIENVYSIEPADGLGVADIRGSLKIHIRKANIHNFAEPKTIKSSNHVEKYFIKTGNYSDISEEESIPTSMKNMHKQINPVGIVTEMKHPYDVPTTTKASFQQTNEINTDAPGTNEINTDASGTNNDISKYRTLLLEQTETRMKNPNEVPENRMDTLEKTGIMNTEVQSTDNDVSKNRTGFFEQTDIKNADDVSKNRIGTLEQTIMIQPDISGTECDVSKNRIDSFEKTCIMKDKTESKLMSFSDENIKDDESTDEAENIRYTVDNGTVSERIHVESTSYRNLTNLTINKEVKIVTNSNKDVTHNQQHFISSNDIDKEVRITDQDLKGSTDSIRTAKPIVTDTSKDFGNIFDNLEFITNSSVNHYPDDDHTSSKIVTNSNKDVTHNQQHFISSNDIDKILISTFEMNNQSRTSRHCNSYSDTAPENPSTVDNFSVTKSTVISDGIHAASNDTDRRLVVDSDNVPVTSGEMRDSTNRRLVVDSDIVHVTSGEMRDSTNRRLVVDSDNVHVTSGEMRDSTNTLKDGRIIDASNVSIINRSEQEGESFNYNSTSNPVVLRSDEIDEEARNQAITHMVYNSTSFQTGTLVRKDIGSDTVDIHFKRPAPIAQKCKKVTSPSRNEIGVKQENNVVNVPPCSDNSTWKSHKKPNVVFLNMSSRRARALEQKRKQAELSTQKSGKKQNVPFLLGSMFKKRQKPPNESRTKSREVQTFQLTLEPSPPKIMKFETDSIFNSRRNFGHHQIQNKDFLYDNNLISLPSKVELPVERSVDYHFQSTESTDDTLYTEHDLKAVDETMMEIGDDFNIARKHTDKILDDIDTSVYTIQRSERNEDGMKSICKPLGRDLNQNADEKDIWQPENGRQDLRPESNNQSKSFNFSDASDESDKAVFDDADVKRSDKSTQEIDSFVLNVNKRLVVSLRKLTDDDIQKQKAKDDAEQDDHLPSLKPWHCILCEQRYRLKREVTHHVVMVHGISHFDSRLKDYVCHMEDSCNAEISLPSAHQENNSNIGKMENNRNTVKMTTSDVILENSLKTADIQNNKQNKGYKTREDNLLKAKEVFEISHGGTERDTYVNNLTSEDSVTVIHKEQIEEDREIKDQVSEDNINGGRNTIIGYNNQPIQSGQIYYENMIGCSAGNKQARQFERKSSDSEQGKLTLLLQENNKWKCVICGLNFHLKIDVIQHIKMKHKGMSTVSSSFISEVFSVKSDHLTSFQDTSIKDRQISRSPISSPVLSGKVIRRKKEHKKLKVKETTELLIISSKMDSIELEPFQVPIGESESMRQILSVKWHCKLCPNWYRLRKCCLQHVQKEHNVRGNWARFYFHNSQQVTSHPSMEICTGPHVDINAFSFCIVCGRSYNDYNEIMRHMRRNHGYIQEVHRSKCVLNKLEGIKIIVACDIFMDLHVYTVGKGSAKLVDKDFLSELFENGIDGKGDFKKSDVAAAMQLKKILYENGMMNLNQLELDKLKDTDHNFDVYNISFKEDFQWERSGKTTVSDSDIVMTDFVDTDDNKEVKNDLITTDVISLMRCHKCNLSFPDRISLDKHNLTHKVQVKFACRLCNKNFPKLFFLLQHLEIKHNQTHKNYFQFVLEHEQLVLEESGVEDGQNDTKAENLEPLDDKIADIKHSEDKDIKHSEDKDIKHSEELDEEDVETTETRACFVCGKSFETRVAVFTHLKENHSIHNRKCLKCNKTFNNRTELQKHFASTHDIDFVVDLSEQLVRCYICDVLLEDRVALSEHLPQHRKEGFNCNMCDMKYTSGSSLRFHKRTVHWKLEGTRSCKICDKIFTNMKSYELHMINHFYDFLGPMKCTKCDLTLKNKKLYKQHIASHGVSTICEHCGKVCIDQHALRHHVVTHNLNEKCDICGKKLNKYSLKNHMTKVHGDKEKVACHLCGRLVSPSYMKAHVEEMHNRIKVLKRGKRDCDVCGKIFKRPGLLKQHIVVHTGEKPHVCEVCGKAFGHKTALNTHYYTHKGYKPQKCLFCKSSFWLISQCKAHMKAEHDFVDHKLKQACPHCDKRFKHLSGLRLHLDEYHPEKVQGPKFYPCHKCKKEFKYRKSLREHFTTCNPAEKLKNLYTNKDYVDTCYNTDSIIPSQQQAEMVETFQEIIQNPIEMSEISNHTQIMRVDGSVQSQIETMETEQQIMIQDESGEVTYQTIYIQSDEANGQVYMQDIANQDQLVVQDGTEKEELVVALPEDCGEYNVDFISSSNGIIDDGQIGYAEIVVQYQ